LELLIPLKRWPKVVRLAPIVPLLTFFALLPLATREAGPVAGEAWENAADALARYLLGVPGTFLTAWGLVATAKVPREVEGRQIRLNLKAAAWACAAYGLLTAVVPEAPFFPASKINVLTFLATFSVPVEAFRAVCALAAAGFLSWVCVVEAVRTVVQFKRLREEFIPTVAHDLRGPISTIELSTTLLERMCPEGPTSARERGLIGTIAASSRTLGRMAGDLVDLSRIEAKQLTLNKERVDLRGLIGKVAERAQALTRGHRVSLALPEVATPVEVDPGRIEQVLDNLLSNAGKHAEPGTEIEVSVVARLREVEILVTNRGRSIPEEERAKLFLRFYQAKTGEGLGLGLYIVKGLVEAHGGRVWVVSAGGATTFGFSLPRAQAAG
jgi:signal transduction histidine kinase